MATRALIGYLTPQNELISTYNHYDGYPESLGKGLSRWYGSDERAKDIASVGYISYLDPEEGDYESKHNDPASTTQIRNLGDIIDVGNDYGANYLYIWDMDGDEWVVLNTVDGSNANISKLVDILGEVGEQDGLDEGIEKNIIQALKDDAKATDYEVEQYMDSLRRSGDTFPEIDDFVEDFKNYIADKQLEEQKHHYFTRFM